MSENAGGVDFSNIGSSLQSIFDQVDSALNHIIVGFGTNLGNRLSGGGACNADNVIASLEAGSGVNGANANFDWSAGSAYLPKYKSELADADKLDQQGYHQAAEALRTDVAVSVLSDMQAAGVDVSTLKDASGSDLLTSMSDSLGKLTTNSLGVQEFEPGSLMLSAISELAQSGKSIMDAMPEDHFKQNDADAKQKTDWLEATTTFFADLNCLGSTNDDLANSVTRMNAAKRAGNDDAANAELLSAGIYVTDLLGSKMSKQESAFVTSDVVNSAVEDDPLAGVQAGNNVKSYVLISSFDDNGGQKRSAAEISPILALLQSFQAVTNQVNSCVQSTL